ncbi:MAG: valine--tRNA ligase, partial [Oscillospiraceae bacterium]|nr:valine--tRNA ligase [Oscillospiraceae bacterium]
PVYDETLNYAEQETAFEKIISAIKAIRNTRTELNVPPSVKAKLYIETHEIELFRNAELFFQKLASASEIEVSENFVIPDSANAVTDSARIFIPMDQLVDKQKELTRLAKEQEKVQKDIDFLSKKLNNAGFLAKAPENLVKAEQEKLTKAQEKMNKILQSIKAYS